MSRTRRKSIFKTEYEAYRNYAFFLSDKKDIIKRAKLSFTDKAYRNTPTKDFKKQFTRSFRKKSKQALYKYITYGKENFPVEKATVEYDWYQQMLENFKKAGRIETLLSKLFGKSFVVKDEVTNVTLYCRVFRNKLYVSKIDYTQAEKK